MVHGFYAGIIWNKCFVYLFIEFRKLWNIVLYLELIQILWYEINYEFVIVNSGVIFVSYEY